MRPKLGFSLRKVLFCLALMMLHSAAPLAALAADKTHRSGYQLTQKSWYLGVVDVSVCELGVKVYARNSQVTTVCPAPFDQIYVYSAKNHKIFNQKTSDYSNFLGKQFSIALGGASPNHSIFVYKQKTTKVLGQTCDIYVTTPQFALQQIRRKQQNDVNFEAPKLYVLTTNPQLVKNESLCDAIDRIFFLPTAPGMPVAARFQNIISDTTTILQTMKVASATFSASDFQSPRGYQVTKEERDLTVDLGDGKDTLELF